MTRDTRRAEAAMEGRLTNRASAIAGLCMAYAWTYCAFFTSAISPAGMLSSNQTSKLYFLVIFSTLVAYALLIIFDGKERDAKEHPTAFRALAAASIALGTLLLHFGSEGISAWSITGAVLAGAGTSLLSVSWCAHLAQIDEPNVDVMVAAAFFGAMVLAVAMLFIPGPAALVCTLALPFGSTFLLERDVRNCVPGKGPSSASYSPAKGYAAQRFDAKRHPESSSLLKIRFRGGFPFGYACIVLVLFWFIHIFLENNASNFLLSKMDMPFALVFSSGCLTTVAIMAACLWYSKEISFSSVLYISIPLLVCGMASSICLPSEWSLISYLLSFAAMMSANIFIWVIAINLAKRGVCSAVKSLSAMRSLNCLGIILSSMLSPLLLAQDLGTVYFSLVCLLFMAVLLGFAAPFAGDAPSSKVRKGACQASIERLLPEDATCDEAPLDLDIAALADGFKLTPREAEILDLLARGRSAPYIKDMLIISRNTVNTHIRHIYEKMNVHTKQELLDIIERSKREGEVG